MPGALVEPLFLTAPGEAALATTAAGQKRIAQALRTGLEDFLVAAPKQ
jgi:N-acetylmuramoyl-L-alanine amidase